MQLSCFLHLEKNCCNHHELFVRLKEKFHRKKYDVISRSSYGGGVPVCRLPVQPEAVPDLPEEGGGTVQVALLLLAVHHLQLSVHEGTRNPRQKSSLHNLK